MRTKGEETTEGIKENERKKGINEEENDEKQGMEGEYIRKKKYKKSEIKREQKEGNERKG